MKELIKEYLLETSKICLSLDTISIENFANLIKEVKEAKSRIFIAGVGGSAANASHAVNDFRKILGIETHSLTENISELTARINDDGWQTSLVETLKVFNPTEKDTLIIFSVGGGSDTTSNNLTNLMKYVKSINMKLGSVVSRDGGYAKKLSDVCVHIPVLCEERITPHAEETQGIVWHMVTSILRKLT